VFTDALKAFAENEPCLTLKLAATGLFPITDVVYIAPVVTIDLLKLHRRFHNRLNDLGTSPNQYYLPGNWVPPCTITSDLADDQIAAAVDVCRKSDLFGSTKLVEIALVEFRPIKGISAFSLLEG